MAHIRWIAALTVSACLLAACGAKTKAGKTVNARLALANATKTSLLATTCPDMGGGFRGDSCWTPTRYAMKLLNVVISPDAQGATSGPAGLIWKNPDCATKTSTSTINNKEYTYDSISDDCTDDKVTKYFDFARTTEAVNADLNSQDLKILPGTYNYVQMTFCIGGAKSDNAEFTADGMTEPFKVKSNQCGITSIKAEPPIVVGEGESVTISVAYDLQNIIFHKQGSNDLSKCYVSADSQVIRCFGYPNSMTPSFAKR